MSDVQKNYAALKEKSTQALAHFVNPNIIQIRVGSATCENTAGAKEVAEEFAKHIKAANREDIYLHHVGCTGRCSCEPIMTVLKPGCEMIVYQKVDRDAVHKIFTQHIQSGEVVKEYQLNNCDCAEKNKLQLSFSQKELSKQPITKEFFDLYGKVPFYCNQSRIALRNAGIIDPENIFEYLDHHGFLALSQVLEKNDPVAVINEIEISKLRGRGGGGYPTATKWKFARNNAEQIRYIICNADEGDPGAFMDRSVLESDPFSVIEGLMLGGFAIGAEKGFFYVRAEYPLAIERLEKALAACKENGLLGENILGSGFNFEIEIRLGAGAFVCGEETALIHSIEGERGQPRIRPPYPTTCGLWGKPTVINNVETLANIPAIIVMGGEEFAKIGTEKSGGTKVFALAGKVKRTGLVEVPMGTTLREVVYTVGGGIPNNKKIKAVQTGGPSGGLIPESLIDTPIDYENLSKIGSIMGSGGMILLDEDDCIVDVAKFYLGFTQDESCGKCSPCREGTLRMLEILEKITVGNATLKDLDNLERLANLVKKASLCGLGKGAPNPVLSSIKNFRSEYEAHIVEKRCPAGKCKKLISYKINPEKCIGCGACARACPVQCISGERKEPHVIDPEKCIKCGRCFKACKFGAVIVN